MTKLAAEHRKNLPQTALRRYQAYKELFLKQQATADNQNRRGK